MTATPTFFSQIREALRPPARPPIEKWATERMRFDPAIAPTARYALALAPFHAQVFSWWLSPDVEEIFLLLPTQSGKTTAMEVLMAYSAEHDPGATLFCGAEETPTGSFMQDRLRRNMRATFPRWVSEPGVKTPLWTENKGAWIGTQFIWPAWATSESRMRSKFIRYVFGDETSLWKESMAMAWERTKKCVRNRKGLWATTPTVEDEQSWITATKTFQLHRWRVPCPHCGAFQILTWDNLRFDHCKTAGAWDLDLVERETFYECSHCKKGIHECDRRRILCAGDAHTEFPERSGKRVSLRITCLDVPDCPWGASARKFLESLADIEALRVFRNGWQVEPWKTDGGALKGEAILARSHGNKHGTAPADTAYLVAFTDVQRGHVWTSVRAVLWDRRSVLVAAVRTDGEGRTRKALDRCWDEVLSMQFPVAGKDSMEIRLSAADSSDGETMRDVYDWCDKHRGRILPCKGVGKEQAAGRWHTTEQDENINGRRLVLTLYRHNVSIFREQVLGAYQRPVDEPGAWLVCGDCPPEYAKHVTAWAPTTVKRGREQVTTLEQKSKDDHLLDCDIGCAFLQAYLGDPRKPGEQKVFKPRQEPQRVIRRVYG